MCLVVFQRFHDVLYILSDQVIENPFTEEFVYLKSAGAYELKIVHNGEIDAADYYTMSRAGVTHFVGNDTDFTQYDSARSRPRD